jgi:hypothetical protein
MNVKLGPSPCESNKLRIFENTVLKGISGLQRYEMTKEYRKLHDMKLFNLFLIRLLRIRPSGHREASTIRGNIENEGYTSMLRVVLEPMILHYGSGKLCVP